MRKLNVAVIFPLVITMMFYSCSAGSGFRDALEEDLVNISPIEQGGDDSTDEPEADKVFGYGVYSSLLYAYEKALTIPGSGEGNGTLYANLIDLNNDETLELIVARVFNGEYGEYPNDEHLDINHEDFIGGYYNPTVMVYTIDDDGGASFVQKFSLSFYGEEGMQFNVEYAAANGKNYLVTSNFTGEVYEQILWEYSEGYFSVAKIFETSYEYENAMYHPTSYYVDSNQVSNEIFENEMQQWNSNTESHTIVGVGFPTSYEEVTEKTKAFLEDYPRGNSVGESAVFNNGAFVIIEEHPQTYEEIAIVDFEKAKVLRDYDELLRITNSEEEADYVIDMYERGSYLPGAILENINPMYIEEAGIDSIALAESIAQNTDVSQLQNPCIISTKRQSVIDMEVVQYQGQYGQPHMQWHIVDKISDTQVVLDSTFDSNHLGQYDDLYHVLFVGYEQEIFDAFGYEIPVFTALTEEEQNSIEFFSTEGGNEYYLIVNSWGAPMKIYENSAENVRGDLLYETTGSVLYLRCNISEMYNDVEVVSAPYEGAEFSYYPSLYPVNNTPVFGNYASQLK